MYGRKSSRKELPHTAVRQPVPAVNIATKVAANADLDPMKYTSNIQSLLLTPGVFIISFTVLMADNVEPGGNTNRQRKNNIHMNMRNITKAIRQAIFSVIG